MITLILKIMSPATLALVLSVIMGLVMLFKAAKRNEWRFLPASQRVPLYIALAIGIPLVTAVLYFASRKSFYGKAVAWVLCSVSFVSLVRYFSYCKKNPDGAYKRKQERAQKIIKRVQTGSFKFTPRRAAVAMRKLYPYLEREGISNKVNEHSILFSKSADPDLPLVRVYFWGPEVAQNGGLITDLYIQCCQLFELIGDQANCKVAMVDKNLALAADQFRVVIMMVKELTKTSAPRYNYNPLYDYRSLKTLGQLVVSQLSQVRDTLANMCEDYIAEPFKKPIDTTLVVPVKPTVKATEQKKAPAKEKSDLELAAEQCSDPDLRLRVEKIASRIAACAKEFGENNKEKLRLLNVFYVPTLKESLKGLAAFEQKGSKHKEEAQKYCLVAIDTLERVLDGKESEMDMTRLMNLRVEVQTMENMAKMRGDIDDGSGIVRALTK